jgi:hypothetical protein
MGGIRAQMDQAPESGRGARKKGGRVSRPAAQRLVAGVWPAIWQPTFHLGKRKGGPLGLPPAFLRPLQIGDSPRVWQSDSLRAEHYHRSVELSV